MLLLAEGAPMAEEHATDDALFARTRELESQQAGLRDRLEFLELIFQGDRLAAYDLHVPSGEIIFDAQLHNLLGRGPGECAWGIEHFRELWHPQDGARVREAFEAYLDGRAALFDVEYRIQHKSGDWVWVRDRCRLVARDEEGRPLRVRGALRDISARKRVEQALRESEERYRRITEAVTDYIYTVRIEEGRAVETRHGPGCVAVTGYTCEEFAGDPFLWHRMVVDADRLVVEAQARRLVAGENAPPLEHRLVRKDGVIRWVRNTAVPHHDAHGRLVAYDGLIQDITERKRAEEHLAAERERLAVTLRSIGDGVIATDTEARVQIVNRVAEQLTGWEQKEALGRSLIEVLRVIDQTTRQPCEDPLAKVLGVGDIASLASKGLLVARDGTERAIAESAAPILDMRGRVMGVVLVLRDVTEKERIEQELRQTQKLETLALLAGGIAHDFNNILTGILGNVSLAKGYLEKRSKAFERLGEAERAAFRAKDLTQQLLTFSRGGAPIRKPGHVGPLLREAAIFALRGSNVCADFALSEELWPAEVDAGQINQAVGNIVLNAVQAMPTGGTLHVCAENIVLDDGNALALCPGRYVKISITDTGIGIPESVVGRVFDPFFTTKQKGNGLGLTTTHSIIKAHGGHIAVESHVGVGSTFTLHLPATSIAVDEAEETPAALLFGHGRVLVMDDEAIVRDVAAEILGSGGYTVECARDGEEALKRFQRARAGCQPFDVVVMDLTIPGGMGGCETLAKLRETDADVRAVLSSGHSNDPIVANYRKRGFHSVLVKPYTADSLLEAVRAALSRAD
jgi:PAS domain S-box-containing protein